METINRSAVIVKPSQAFLEWLQQVDPTSAALTLQDLRQDPSIYLLPEWDTEKEALQHLSRVCSRIFEEQLDSWYRVRASWPEDRGVKTFLRWFDCEFCSMVIDACGERLRRTAP